MKKSLMILFALVVSLTVSAQNLANGKTAIATTGNAAEAIDGNTGTRWESAQGVDPQTWQVDLGSAQEFNTIKIVWEGAYGKTFTIEAGNEVDADGYLTGGTTIVNVEGQALAGFPYTQTLNLTEAVTARYVKFNGVERGTQYGYSFWEFEIYNIGEQTLGSLALSVPDADKNNPGLTACKVGSSIKVTPVAKDVDNVDYPTDGVTYEATNGTIDAAGNFTPTAKGECTITATLEGKTATVTVYAYEGDNLCKGKNFFANPEGTNVDLFFDGDWGNRGGLGQPADNHTWVYVDLGAYYTIDLVDLKQEQANGKDYTIQFSADAETWVTAYTITDQPGLQGDVRQYFFGSAQNTNVRYVRFDCTAPATGYGVSIYEMAAYGVKTADIQDNVKPVVASATVSDIAATSAKLTINASDDQATTLTYTVSDAANGKSFTTTGAAGGNTVLALTNLNPGTTYNFTVVANDGVNDSEPFAVQAFTTATLTAAPVPTKDAADVISLYSDTYTSASPGMWCDAWGSPTVFSQIQIDGNNTYTFNNLNYYGIVLGAQVDVTEMETMHIDIYADNAGTVGIVPIWWNAAANQNFGEIRYTAELNAGQWNSLDIPLSAFADAGRNGTNVIHQIKLDNGNGNNVMVDNIYFWKENAVADDEAPVLTKAEATTVEAEQAVITVSATDNQSANISYKVWNGGDVVAQGEGASGAEVAITVTGLTPETDYELSVTAYDKAENESDALVVEFTTPVKTDADLVDTGADDNGVHKMSGKWNADDFAAIDAVAKASAYDLTAVTTDGTLDVIGKTANPFCLFVTAHPGVVNRNEVVKGDNGYNGYALFFQEEWNTGKPYDINTSIAPITVANPFFQRLFDRAGYYVSMTVPFDYNHIPDAAAGTKFYELKSAGETAITFAEVSEIKANKPYLVYAATGGITIPDPGTVIIDWDAQTASTDAASFTANYASMQGNGTQFVLPGAVLEDNLKLQATTGVISPFRAYLTISAAAAGAKFDVLFEDATGIHAASTDAIEAIFNVYSVDGRLVKRNSDSMIGLKKGVYVINGKKVLVK